MRFHVVSLPHTQVTEAFSACAFTEKVRKFCRMMHERGHLVVLYAGEQNEAPCTEHIVCVSEAERREAVAVHGHYSQFPFEASHPLWVSFNERAAAAIAKRAQTRDFVCVMGGAANRPIADALPDLMTVELGIGYAGVFARYKVFESYAWMHTIYGAEHRADSDGVWYDEVIPGHIEREKFPLVESKQDYCLFIGRLTPRKGFRIAEQVCHKLGRRLILCGYGDTPEYGEYRGVVGPQQRGELMGNARAVLVPTIYIEPFGMVAIEAMACGTPVITSDWGAFTETVIDRVTGFRCRNFQQFCDAVDRVEMLDPRWIHRYAIDHFSLDAVAPRYETYFQRLLTLWGDGWYAQSGASR